MAQAAALMLQGLSLGGQHGQQEWHRRQQAAALARQLAGQAAARRALKSEYDMFAPLPSQYIDDPTVGEDQMGPAGQIENPDFKYAMGVRGALADPNLPVEVMENMVGAERDVAKHQRIDQFRQQLQDKDISKMMSRVQDARKMGIGPRHSKRIALDAQALGIPESYFDPMSADTVQGVMNRDPGSIAQMMQHGSIPSGLMPSASAPQDITGDMVTRAQAGDPNAIAEIKNRLGGRSITDLMPKVGKSITTPEQAQARLKTFFDSAGGEDSFDPLSLAILKDRAMRGERFTSSELMGSLKSERWAHSGEEAALKYEVEDLQHDLHEAEKRANDPYARGAAKEKALAERNMARQVYQAKRAELADLYKSRGMQKSPTFSAPAPTSAPPPASGPPSPGSPAWMQNQSVVRGLAGWTPAGQFTREAALKQAWSDLGLGGRPGASLTPQERAAVKARITELMGAQR